MTDAEVQEYFEKHAIRSWNGVLDDCIFGVDDEWYVIIYNHRIKRQPEPYAGPFKSYDEASTADLMDIRYQSHVVTGYIYTK